MTARHASTIPLLAALVFLSAAGGCLIQAAEPAPAGQPAWKPAFYGFCIDTHDAKKRTIPEQAQMLRKLGFDGVGYPLWLDDNLDKNLKVVEAASLKVFQLHTSVNVNPEKPPYDPRLPDQIRKLKGRPVTVGVLLRGFPPGDPRGDEPAVKILRQLGDVAIEAGVRISIYHHVSDWTESLIHALQVVKKTNHPAVGANFNLCHWLKVDGTRDHRSLLRENASKIFAVTICGAEVGSNAWTNGLIQSLDRGDFDNRALLATLRDAGYRGPIGLMCYGIPGDAHEHLERSMKAWPAIKPSGE